MWPHSTGVSVWWIHLMLYSIPWFLLFLWPSHCGTVCGSLTWVPDVHLCEETTSKSHFVYITIYYWWCLIPFPPSPSPSPLFLLFFPLFPSFSLPYLSLSSPFFSTSFLSPSIFPLSSLSPHSLLPPIPHMLSLQKYKHYADVLTIGLKDKHSWFGGWDIARRLPFVLIAFFVVLGRPSIILVSAAPRCHYLS